MLVLTYRNFKMEAEIWKPVVGYEKSYEVSNLGTVRSVTRYVENGPSRRIVRPRLMNQSDNGKGYKCVNLSKDGKVKAHYVHRIVLIAFNPTHRDGVEVNHKNGVKADNRLCNLEWVTHADNQRHAAKVLRAMSWKRSPDQMQSRYRAVIGTSISDGTVIRLASVSSAKKLGMHPGNISSACSGRIKSAHGYRWEYEADTIVTQ